MKMIKAIVRMEKADEVVEKLLTAGFPAMTRIDVYGRGRQKGLQVGTVFYDELPKKLIMIVADDENVDTIVDIICASAKTGEEGNFGDGRIFISEVEEAYTISSKSKQL